MNDMKAFLRCHTNVSKSVHRGTATASNYPRTHFASTRLGPGPKNGDHPFPTHSVLDDVRKDSEPNGGAHGVHLASPSRPPTGMIIRSSRSSVRGALNEQFFLTINKVKYNMK